ncbi:hypothetical protein AbraIFM66951_006389 [Aspergillus brasiliensis]|uniref:Uncharacterized protein n=1 Tax=Aspergillus brasiliensis TaxID=319629 RepID=A0A9W5YGX9_9EURO|nr:hypothetical protein AbraCBS73388_004282 [Aspergillus brasiliensis]GKZ40851.1 hypothetical protein AbraIFM66951_006389 [Aspergillus brasiliensis]
MSTKKSRPQDSSFLGESWVVASPHEENEKQDERQPSEPSSPTPRPARRKRNYGSESMSTSTSSASGPELIMPSIYEAPLSEGSWVAPTTRPERPLRRRAQKPPKDSAQEEKQQSLPPKQQVTAATPARTSRQPRARKFLESILRTLLNCALIAAIAHMLVVPEIVQQYQTLCSSEKIATLYPASCVPPYPQPQLPRHQPAPRDTVTTSHSRLETLLSSTLNETVFLANTLKQSESKLRDIHADLKQAYPSSKHELDLEFTGCLQATRTAAGKFDSLRADIRSAVDSLIASGDNIQGLPQHARHATQMARREQYLDQLTTRMQSKVDSLSTDLATLDDHLESIGTIVARESKQPKPSSSTPAPGPNNPGPEPGPKSDQPPRLRTFVDSFLGVNLPAILRPITTESESAISSPDPSLADLFREASTNHRPVIKVVRNLSNQLQILQQRRYSAI